MANAETSTLVFKDQAGEYYLVSQETLEQGRVAEEHKTEVEQLIAEQADVQGHLFHVVHIFRTVAVIATGAVLVIQEALEDEGSGMTNAQYVEQLTGRPFPR